MGWYTGLKASVSAYLKLRRKRSRHLGNVELKSRTGPFGPVVSQLRARARTFEFWGRVVLFALLVVVGVGIGYYFYSPNLQDANVIEGRVHAQTISLRQDDLNSLDKERDTLRDEMLARVQQVFVARPIEVPDYLGLPDLFVSEIDFGPRGEAIALGPDGRILTHGSGQSDWVAGPVSPDPGRLDEVHIGPDGYAIALGKGGTILTREPGQAEWIDRTVDGTSAQFRDAAIGENGDVVVVGTAGTIVTREPGVSAWASQQIDDISVILYDVELGEDGEAVIVGTGGRF